MPITGFFVTYNDVLAPGGFHRVTTAAAGRADINEHSDSAVQSYLWVTESPSAGEPIVDVLVLDGGEDVPEGYERIKRNLTKGTDSRKYLCVKRSQAEGDVPVSHVCIVFGDQAPEDGDFEEVNQCILGGSVPARLFLKRSTGEAGWSGFDLKLDDWVDALDTESVWRVAQVIEATDGTVTIHYKNWGSKWDDTMPRDSPKLAPVGTHTSGKDTGWRKRTVGGIWAVSEEEIASFKEKLRVAHDARSSGQEQGGSRFWVVDLPHFVEACMTSQYEDPSVLPIVMDFLRYLMDVVVDNIGNTQRPVMPEILQQFHRLCGVDQHCAYFYDRYSKGHIDSIAEYVDEPQDYLAFRQNTGVRVLVGMMNYMGRLRGFELIASRIGLGSDGPSGPVCSLTEVDYYVRTISYLRTLYTKPFLKSYFKTFHEVVLDRLISVSDDELKSISPSSNDAIETIVHQLEILVNDVRPDLNSEEIIEKFKMRMAKRLIICPLLNYRIKGVSHINDMISVVSNYESNKTNYMNLGRSSLPRPLLSGDWIAEFLTTERVPELVLGDPEVLKELKVADTHIELMKRSTDMLLFLASQGKLSSTVLDTLWKAAEQPSQQRSVFAILVSVMPRLTAEQLDDVDEKVRALLPSELQDVHIDLVREFTEASLGRIRERQTLSFGLDLLWQTLHGGSTGAAADSTTDHVLDAICDLTERDPNFVVLSLLSTAAIQNIRNRTSVTLSIKALHRMIGCLPTSRSTTTRGRPASKSRERVLLELHNEHKLLQLCIDEFKAIHEKDASKKEERRGLFGTKPRFGRGRKGVASPPPAAIDGSEQEMKEGVMTRLNFLAFIVQNCSVELAFSQILHLYNACTLEKLFEEETNLILRWLSEVAPHETVSQSRSNSLVTMSRETLFSIFEQLLCKNDGSLRFETLSKDGYECIERYFKLVNTCLKPSRLTIQHEGRLFVENADLKGFGILWSILLHCENEEVRAQVTEFVILLQLQLSKRLSKRTVWEGFIQKCMQQLSANLASGSDGDAAATQILRLLRSFLLEIKVPDAEVTPTTKPSLATIPALVLGPDESILRVIVRSSGRKNYLNRELRLVVKGRVTTVGMLRKRIAALVRYPPNKTRILNRRGEYLPCDRFDTMALESANLMQYGVVDVDLRVEAGTDTLSYVHPEEVEDLENERLRPLRMLANVPEHFGLLFRLMDSGSAVVEEAWLLVEILPQNDAMVSEIQNFDEGSSFMSRDLQIDASSIPRVLYQLRIATEIVESSFDPFMPTKASATAWILSFVKRGGISYLLRLLTSSDIGSMANSSLGKKFLTAVLKLTSLFAKGLDDSGPSQAAPPSKDQEKADEAKSQADCAEEVRRVLIQEMGHKDIMRLLERLLEVVHHVSSTAKERVLTDAEKEHLKELKREEQRRRRFETFKSMTQNSSGKALERDGSFLADEGGEGNAQEGDPSGSLTTEAVVCKNSFEVFDAVSRLHPQVVMQLAGIPVLHEAVVHGVLRSPEKSIRVVVAKGVLRICRTSSECSPNGSSLASALAKMLCDALSEVLNHEKHCREFFLTACRIVKFEGALQSIDVSSLANFLRAMIVERGYAETSSETEDPVLSGTASLLKEVLVAAGAARVREVSDIRRSLGQSGLLEELFDRCLFEMPVSSGVDRPVALRLAEGSSTESSPVGTVADPPKAKNSNTRKACFELLAELCRGGGASFDSIVSRVQAHHGLAEVIRSRSTPAKGGKREPADDDSMDLTDAEDSDSGSARRGSDLMVRPSRLAAPLPKSTTGYVGLANLGCICYLNSILQQLFMMPRFRRAILDFEDEDEDDEDDTEDIIAQLQKMFSYLQNSEKAAYNPRSFTQAFKDWDNQPIDVLVQQDAAEFFSNLLTKLESKLMTTDSENLLEDTVQGTVAQELLAEPDKYREREDVFYLIEVPILNLRSLEESLAKFIEGETVEYTWEEEGDGDNGEKVVKKETLDTTKRFSLKKLPPHLVIHLKRFDFDYETFQQIKLNDYFEFPMELDVREYTQDGRGDATPDSKRSSKRDADAETSRGKKGSFRNATRFEDLPEEAFMYELAGIVVHMGTANSGHYYSYIKERGSKDRWFEFNDTFVGEFDPEDIPAECFGGEEEVNYMYGNFQNSQGASRTYTRRKIQNAFMLIYDQKLAKEDDERRSLRVRRGRQLYPVPRKLADTIRTENEHYWRQNNILNRNYFAFMTDLLYRSEANTRAQGKLAADFFFGTLYAAREREVLKTWEKQVVSILGANTEARQDFLLQISNGSAYLEDVYTRCADSFCQGCIFDALAGVLMAEFRHLQASNRSQFRSLQRVTLQNVDAAPAALQPILRFVAMVNALLARIVANPKPGKSFFRPIEGLARASWPLADVMVRSGMLARLQVLFLGSSVARDHDVAQVFPSFDLDVDVATDAYFKYRGLDDASLLPAIYAIVKWYSLVGAPMKYPNSGETPCPALAGLELALVTSEAFVNRMVLEVKTRALQLQMSPLIWHLCYENENVSKLFVNKLQKAVVVHDDVDLKKPFRCLYALVSMEDSLRPWRVRALVYTVLEEVFNTLRYLRASEVNLEMLFRLVKNYPYVNVLLKGDTKRLQFIVDYLDNRLRNSYASTYQQQLFKAKRTGQYQHSPQRGNFDARRLLDRFRKLRDEPPDVSADARKKPASPQDMPASDELADLALEEKAVLFEDPGYDSDDDPSVLLGARISVRWREGRCYPGEITEYDGVTNKHKVVYDDGDVREYIIVEKTYTFEDTSKMRRSPPLSWADYIKSSGDV